ncbi:UNVERIFIED_CONTAM: hypothetical protein HDU68_008990 [Siphonaria sp. JEL0065]|nr:hypothetical protein HDU68_008990 [Siphonaria sp. JEL0065]
MLFTTGTGSIQFSRMAFTNQIASKTKTAVLITLSNTAKKNALSPVMMHQLGKTLDSVAAMASKDKELVAVILAGDGNTFCSGFDLSSNVESGKDPVHSQKGEDKNENPFFTMDYANSMATLMHTNMLKLHRLPLISVAAVDGYALGGGCELMSWCDLRVMSAHAKAGFLQTKMGVVCGWGGATRLRTGIMSPGEALRLLSCPRIKSAHECYTSKLITHIESSSPSSHHPPTPTHHTTAMEIIERDVFGRDWVDAYPAAVRSMKKLMICGVAGDGIDLEGMLKRERQEFCGLWGGSDNIEAVSSASSAGKSRL